jgi:hypothetical protein
MSTDLLTILIRLKNLEKIELILEQFDDRFWASENHHNRAIAGMEIDQRKLLRVRTLHMKPYNQDLWKRCPNVTSLSATGGLIAAIAISASSHVSAIHHQFIMLRHLCIDAMWDVTLLGCK